MDGDGRPFHNVVDDGFKSAEQSTGIFSYTFDQPGTFDYECNIHPGMEGTVVMRASQ